MTHGFDKDYWESHWRQANPQLSGSGIDPNPYLAAETRDLAPGTALDAGCGEGAEAIWLAAAGWQVTAADISAEALARASRRAQDAGAAAERVKWVEADLGSWEPDARFDLVTTHYAHPAMPQLAFYHRISRWVTPGGTLLIVGHLASPDATGGGPGHGSHGHESHGNHGGHGDHGGHPPEATATPAGITAQLDPVRWDVITARENTRTLRDASGRDDSGRDGSGGDGPGRAAQLRDVVVRATRRS